MISRYDIIQGTPEWHECRWAKIDGTRKKITECCSKKRRT